MLVIADGTAGAALLTLGGNVVNVCLRIGSAFSRREITLPAWC
jgi:hypothetical protein